MNDNRRFITIEGVEGAGKSTAVARVAAILRADGHDVLVTREPGGTRFGERLRELVLTPTDAPIDPLAELLIMFADRAQHLEEQIRPALAAGHWVVCDRFTDSTYAYQGAGRGLPGAAIEALEALVQQGLTPGLTLLLDIDAEAGRERAARRSRPDRIESADRAFFERVRQGFLSVARREPQRFRIVDAGRALPAVEADVTEHVLSHLRAIDG